MIGDVVFCALLKFANGLAMNTENPAMYYYSIFQQLFKNGRGYYWKKRGLAVMALLFLLDAEQAGHSTAVVVLNIEQERGIGKTKK